MTRKITPLLKNKKTLEIPHKNPHKKPQIKFSDLTDEEIDYINTENAVNQDKFNDEIYYQELYTKDYYNSESRKKKTSSKPKRKVIKKCKCK